VASSPAEFRVRESSVQDARIFDFGIRAEGGLDAGQALAEICMAGLGWVSILPGDVAGVAWPHVFVTTDHPTAACLYSQYAGWQIATEGFFAMGSGPMRAAYAHEELYAKLDYREVSSEVVGVLEGRKLPNAAVVRYICERTGVTSDKLCLLIAPTASQAGNVQVVARSIETALHKLLELGFDVRQIKSACGSAPLPPVAADDLAGIGRTNDAILYGARVTLWVRGEDSALAEVGPAVPACSSSAFGKPFLEVFEAAGRDFYKIDRHLFSPAEVTFCNLDTGKVHRFGRTEPDVLKTSFGIG
jgi:methenyltetrahydromethanopterin cyclohydrolase